jgi:hypothetical protein
MCLPKFGHDGLILGNVGGRRRPDFAADATADLQGPRFSGTTPMRRVLILLAVTMLAASALTRFSNPALAQMPTPGLSLGGDKEVSEEDKARAKAREDAARAASARIPVQQKASNDPWAGARDVTPPPAAPAMQINPKQKKK